MINYLVSLEWDRKLRLETWTIEFLGVEDSPFVRATSSRFLIAAVARVLEPGCKADCVPILEGRQGIGKSAALRTLFSPWFTDDIEVLGTKDAAMQIPGAWCIELSELDAIARGEISKTKAFVSRQTDRFRPPYGRRVVDQPRQCVFAGTVNGDDYLRDETGGRRFWPWRCMKIEIPGLTAAKDQLWAEARARYDQGRKWWLDTRELNSHAEAEQDQRYQADAWQSVIEEFVSTAATTSVAEILQNALHLPIDRWGQSEQNRVARCLRKLGWERFRGQRTGHKRQWLYRRPVPLGGDDQ